MSEEPREMHIDNEYPLGGCPKCRMPLMKINSVKQCPNCSTKSEPSGLVNTTADPGHEALTKLLASPEEANKRIGGENPFKKIDAKELVSKIFVAAQGTKEDIVRQVLTLVGTIPLPKDIKEYKKIAKVKTLLESMLIQEEQNNG